MLGDKKPSFEGTRRENPRGPKNPRKHMPPAGTNPSGRKKGDGYSAGINPLERRWKADKVFYENAGTERERETSFRPVEWRKALKGKTHGRRELKEASWDARKLKSPRG